MNTNTKHIAVLLTCFNRKEKTLKGLASLFEQKLIKGLFIEVFLVDDGSTDGTAEAVFEKFPQVNIIQGTGNLFWNRGMHKAWEEAVKVKDYDYYFWLNDDTNICNNAVTKMIRLSINVNDNSIIVGAVHSEEEKTKDSYGGYKNGKLLTPDGTPQECDEFNGNCVLIPQRVFKALGNLDLYFKHSFGDIEYGRRARKNKIKIYLTEEYVGTCNRNSWPQHFYQKKIIFSRDLKYYILH